MESAAIGIDLGATKIAAALVAGTGEVLAARTLPTSPGEGTQAVLDRMASLANELGTEAARRPVNLLGIGIGSPGVVNAATGTVQNAVNLGWHKVNLADELKVRLKQSLPVWVHKDGNASAIGEYVFGAARGCTDFLYLTIGTGLGGGLFAGGQLITGANDNATELGHISLDPQGRECVCGLRGCAETVLSGYGLVALYESKLMAGTAAVTRGPGLISTAAIIEAAKENDLCALEALAEMGRQLGIVIAFCAAVTNPSLVVIGGGLGLAIFEQVMPRAKMELQTRVLKASHAGLKIVPSQQSSSAVGAASLVWYFTERR
ncbi:MAG TPA: ROK family protein [Anaerolineales bacterium]|jgi:glucokinase